MRMTQSSRAKSNRSAQLHTFAGGGIKARGTGGNSSFPILFSRQSHQPTSLHTWYITSRVSSCESRPPFLAPFTFSRFEVCKSIKHLHRRLRVKQSRRNNTSQPFVQIRQDSRIIIVVHPRV